MRTGVVIYDSFTDRADPVSVDALSNMAWKANKIRGLPVTREFNSLFPAIGWATNFRVDGTQLLCDLEIAAESLDFGKYSIGFVVRDPGGIGDGELIEVGSTPNPSWEKDEVCE